MKKRPLASAVGCAVLVRVLVALWVCSNPPVITLSNGYIENAASLVSGKGLIMQAGDTDKYDVLRFLKSREQMGHKVGLEDPFPPDTRQWVPATQHPPGYALLLAVFYELGNVTGMLWGVLYLQIALDALTCLLVYAFVRNIFGVDAAIAAAWIYALLPAPILLSMQILPDGLACFLAGAILASASYIPTRGLRAALVTGAIIGIGCLFRAEFVLWCPLVLVLMVAASRGRTAVKLRCCSAVVLSYLAVITPWVVWTYGATGHPVITTSGAGASMYASLGEIPDNPWHVTLDDGWVGADARARGLGSAWTPTADAYYRRLFFSSILRHPAAFVHLWVTQRLPLALAPAYYMGGDMWFATHRLREGLTRWQTFRNYPGATIRREWLKVSMAFVSALLLAAMIRASLWYRHAPRLLSWLWIPWAATVLAITMMKQVEARNIASILVVQVAAAALVISKDGSENDHRGQQSPEVTPSYI